MSTFISNWRSIRACLISSSLPTAQHSGCATYMTTTLTSFAGFYDVCIQDACIHNMYLWCMFLWCNIFWHNIKRVKPSITLSSFMTTFLVIVSSTKRKGFDNSPPLSSSWRRIGEQVNWSWMSGSGHYSSSSSSLISKYHCTLTTLWQPLFLRWNDGNPSCLHHITPKYISFPSKDIILVELSATSTNGHHDWPHPHKYWGKM